MGVPDFLKFVARSAPGALCRVPRGSQAATLTYDYILVDATNAAQTIGLDALEKFLKHEKIAARKAIIFALDAQRSREGTARSHRQSHIMVGDMDVKIQKLCVSLSETLKQRAKAGGGDAPLVLMSGRSVAGEADYKVLDIHRTIMSAALEFDETSLPRVLFISEDSDILCGTLCGPAPQQVSIATNLHDTMFEMGILQLEHVLAYVAVCADALVSGGEEEEEEATAEAPEEEEEMEVEAEEVVEEAVEEEKKVVPQQEQHADDVVRRRKQDGPMVATGVRIALTDSDDDEEEENSKQKSAPAVVAQTKADTSKPTTGSGVSPVPPSEAVAAPLSSFALNAGIITQNSCVDLVFLFVVVMGNGVNVPPLVRGVTKVDIASCWHAYCSKKFSQTDGTVEESELGRTLLSTSPIGGRSSARDGQASLSLDCRFLHSILESVHYADAQSRPPVEDEKNRAVTYLSNAVYATLRYIVACNINSGAALSETFLDSRALSETEVLVPSLAAVLWVLSQEGKRTFHYPLHGLAKKELLLLSGDHDADAAAAAAPAAASRIGGPTLQLDVGEALVAPGATSWAVVRGAGTRTYNIRSLVDKSAGNNNNNNNRNRGSTGNVLKSYASAHQGHNEGLVTNTFTALSKAWKRSVALCVARLRALAKHGDFMSPVTGNVVQGPLGTKDSKAAAAAQQKQVYSFELRRMTPVLVTDEHSSKKQTSTSAVDDAHSSQNAPSSSSATTTEPSPVQRALMAALGISLDYDAVVPLAAPAAAAKQPRVYMDDEDRAEMKRLRKVARAERSKLDAPADSAKTAATKKKDKKTPAGAKAAAAAGEDKTGEPKYKRPGKKERKRLQAERQSAGATVVAAPVATSQNEEDE